MKRSVLTLTALFMALVLCALVFAPLTSALAERIAIRQVNMPVDEGFTFRLPASLVAIEDEAFAGTAVQAAILPDGTQEIGDGAFAGSASLAFVYIPATVTRITGDPLRGTSVLAVIGQEGSTAEKWAVTHGYRFIDAQVWALLMPGHDPRPHRPRLLADENTADDAHPLRPALRDEQDDRQDKRDRPEMRVIDYRFP